MKRPTETYLGDGLYASFDGFSIWLRAPREMGDHIVALEPQVWRALVEYIDRLKLNKDSTEKRP